MALLAFVLFRKLPCLKCPEYKGNLEKFVMKRDGTLKRIGVIAGTLGIRGL